MHKQQDHDSPKSHSHSSQYDPEAQVPDQDRIGTLKKRSSSRLKKALARADSAWSISQLEHGSSSSTDTDEMNPKREAAIARRASSANQLEVQARPLVPVLPPAPAVGEPSSQEATASAPAYTPCPFPECGIVLTDPVILQHHLRYHAGTNPTDIRVPSSSRRKPHTCPYPDCNSTFRTESDLTTHINRHEGTPQFACTHCSRRFFHKSHLTRHTRQHTGEKPYVCEEEGCGRAFARSDDRRLHSRTHRGDKPYICEICGKGFVQLTGLRRHKTAVHGQVAPSKSGT